MKKNIIHLLFIVLLGCNNTLDIRYVIVKSAILREQPNMSSNKILSIPLGTELKILETSNFQEKIKINDISVDNYWYKVKSNGSLGWVYGGCLDNDELIESEIEENSEEKRKGLKVKKIALPSDFEPFLENFFTDFEYQKEHIAFPLISNYIPEQRVIDDGNDKSHLEYTDTPTSEKIRLSDWTINIFKENKDDYLSSQDCIDVSKEIPGLKGDGFPCRTYSKDKDKINLGLIYCYGCCDGYKEYTFKKINNEWSLTKINN